MTGDLGQVNNVERFSLSPNFCLSFMWLLLHRERIDARARLRRRKMENHITLLSLSLPFVSRRVAAKCIISDFFLDSGWMRETLKPFFARSMCTTYTYIGIYAVGSIVVHDFPRGKKEEKSRWRRSWSAFPPPREECVKIMKTLPNFFDPIFVGALGRLFTTRASLGLANFKFINRDLRLTGHTVEF